jgi:hypothetical protein
MWWPFAIKKKIRLVQYPPPPPLPSSWGLYIENTPTPGENISADVVRGEKYEKGKEKEKRGSKRVK